MRQIITLAAVAALALAGCGTTAGPLDPQAVHQEGLATATPTTTTKADPAKNQRGNLTKRLGEAAMLCADKDCSKAALTFTVDKIEVDPKCTDPYAHKYGVDTPPQNGHYVVLHMTVKTTTDMPSEMAPLIGFNGYEFSVIGPDGVTSASADGGYGCMDTNDRLPSAGVSPGSQYQGTVVLDTKHTSGTIAFRFATMNGGWEWSY
jgi:hypothetical protein